MTVSSRSQNLLSRITEEVPTKDIVKGFTGKKISLRDGVFKVMVSGEPVREYPDGPLKTIIIKAAPISRTYYAGEYDEDNPTSPTCSSDDTRTGHPSEVVSEEGRQSATCFDCKWNIKGSGKGDSRGCRFNQRIAVMLSNDEGNVVDPTLFQIQLPATSVFGDNPQRMSMQAYARHLNTHKTPLAAVITELYFEKNNTFSKLLFRPLRAVTEDEFALAVAAQQSPEADSVLSSTLIPQSPFSTEEGFVFNNLDRRD